MRSKITPPHGHERIFKQSTKRILEKMRRLKRQKEPAMKKIYIINAIEAVIAAAILYFLDFRVFLGYAFVLLVWKLDVIQRSLIQRSRISSLGQEAVNQAIMEKLGIKYVDRDRHFEVLLNALPAKDRDELGSAIYTASWEMERRKLDEAGDDQ